eukprot:scaffold1318_cov388-Prasinococcus_capsulatus_cf.AAC.54
MAGWQGPLARGDRGPARASPAPHEHRRHAPGACPLRAPRPWWDAVRCFAAALLLPLRRVVRPRLARAAVALGPALSRGTPCARSLPLKDNTSEAVRLEQLRAALEHLQEGARPPRAHLLVGDFNALCREDYTAEVWGALQAVCVDKVCAGDDASQRNGPPGMFAQRLRQMRASRHSHTSWPLNAMGAQGWEERRTDVVRLIEERGYVDSFRSSGKGGHATFQVCRLGIAAGGAARSLVRPARSPTDLRCWHPTLVLVFCVSCSIYPCASTTLGCRRRC